MTASSLAINILVFVPFSDENILINTLTLQEAKDSSEVENIVTTNDDLYRAELDLKHTIINASTKEVLNYRQALQAGFSTARKTKLLTLNDIKRIQQKLETNNAGFRRIPGTRLKNAQGETVYTPPQERSGSRTAYGQP